MKFKKGDTVKVLLGKDKGKTGKIEKLLPKKGRVVVSGVNVYKKHVKRQSEQQPGGIVELNRPLPISSVVLVCSKCSQPTRVGWSVNNKEKQRICKKCKGLI
ncbi:50S ribosomal protein L24 [Patescibacteria group bacterium]|nr:50S ribosomal protein L24 [Patescibacteria group bacterium]MBU1931289.1 50S ribosomal protein L24 [Patescibacteria group bacterium]